MTGAYRMKKHIARITGIPGIVLTAAGLCMLIYKHVLVSVFMNDIRSQNPSVGIIGGADGPTAVFIGSKAGVEPAIIAIIIAAGVVLMIISWILRIQKKH